MADQIQISAQEIDALAQKLDDMQSMFTERERAALFGLFSLAAEATRPAPKTGGEGAAASRVPLEKLATSAQVLPSLGDGLRGVWVRGTPGTVGGPGSPVADDVHVDVGVACVGGGWTKELKELNPGELVTNPGLEQTSALLATKIRQAGKLGPVR